MANIAVLLTVDSESDKCNQSYIYVMGNQRDIQNWHQIQNQAFANANSTNFMAKDLEKMALKRTCYISNGRFRSHEI